MMASVYHEKEKSKSTCKINYMIVILTFLAALS